jgi:hypothetical protein
LCAAIDGRLRKESKYCPACERVSAERRTVDQARRSAAWYVPIHEAIIARLREHASRPCDFCGRPIGAMKNISKKYCSSACVKKAYEAKIPEIVQACAWCGADYTLEKSHRKFCSEACARASAARDVEVWLAALRAATRERNPDRPCDYCGNFYTPKTSRNRFCTPSCQAKLSGKRVSVLIEPRARRLA